MWNIPLISHWYPCEISHWYPKVHQQFHVPPSPDPTGPTFDSWLSRYIGRWQPFPGSTAAPGRWFHHGFKPIVPCNKMCVCVYIYIHILSTGVHIPTILKTIWCEPQAHRVLIHSQLNGSVVIPLLVSVGNGDCSIVDISRPWDVPNLCPVMKVFLGNIRRKTFHFKDSGFLYFLHAT